MVLLFVLKTFTHLLKIIVVKHTTPIIIESMNMPDITYPNQIAISFCVS